jgi:hypothetical protein
MNMSSKFYSWEYYMDDLGDLLLWTIKGSGHLGLRRVVDLGRRLSGNMGAEGILLPRAEGIRQLGAEESRQPGAEGIKGAGWAEGIKGAGWAEGIRGELVWGGGVLGRGGEDDHVCVEVEMEDGGSYAILFNFHLVGAFPKCLIFCTEGVSFYLIWNHGGDGYLDI